jgi:hypothetical protein
MIMQAISAIRKDFIATYLRFQLNSLKNILDDIEEQNKVDCGYTRESLKDIEIKLRQLRKLCVN